MLEIPKYNSNYRKIKEFAAFKLLGKIYKYFPAGN